MRIYGKLFDGDDHVETVWQRAIQLMSRIAGFFILFVSMEPRDNMIYICCFTLFLSVLPGKNPRPAKLFLY